MNPRDICKDVDVFLVTLVTTTHDHIKRREIVRSTWASVKQVDDKRIVTVFILGKSNSNDMWTSLREYRKYNDIISFDFNEDYLNLTLKTLLGLKWAGTFCSSASFIMKTDDDVFVNYLSLVRKLVFQPVLGTAFGLVMKNAPVARKNTDKWYTSKDVYPLEKYPDYLQGASYVLSKDVAENVTRISPLIRYIDWEDVFVGLCLQKLDIHLTSDHRFDHKNSENLKETVGTPCPVHYIFTIHGHGTNLQDLMQERWQRLLMEKQRSICRWLYPANINPTANT
ncbi:beta-1,3-galactosyltransferase 1-like [Glandiceps talaboti]